jgi:hypothetical protein
MRAKNVLVLFVIPALSHLTDISYQAGEKIEYTINYVIQEALLS